MFARLCYSSSYCLLKVSPPVSSFLLLVVEADQKLVVRIVFEDQVAHCDTVLFN